MMNKPWKTSKQTWKAKMETINQTINKHGNHKPGKQTRWLPNLCTLRKEHFCFIEYFKSEIKLFSIFVD